MVDEKKSLGENEIELSEAISIIWNNKFKIFFSSFLPAALIFLYFIMQDPVKPIFKNSADISPITILDELEYKNYNSHLHNYRNYIDNLTRDMNKLIEGSNSSENINNVFQFYRIDRRYLMKLFIEKLSDKDFIIESIKKYGLVKKKNFENLKKYENEVFKIASSFDLSSSESIGTKFPKYHIQYETHDIDNYVGYLNFLNNLVNSEIQKY